MYYHVCKCSRELCKFHSCVTNTAFCDHIFSRITCSLNFVNFVHVLYNVYSCIYDVTLCVTSNDVRMIKKSTFDVSEMPHEYITINTLLWLYIVNYTVWLYIALARQLPVTSNSKTDYLGGYSW